MTLKSDLTSFGQRMTEFAERFERRLRAEVKKGEQARGLDRTIQAIRDFFTQGVTRDGLRDLVQRDPQETFRFFTQEIDFAALRPLPWYKRYPLTVWKVFLAMAYRLSPPRRIAFAAAALAFVVGLVRLVFSSARSVRFGIDVGEGGALWWLISLAILFLLLLMELKDKVGLKGDLEIAREIQFGLVPSQPFRKGDISVHCYMRPANTVGGDYFDIITLGDDGLGLVVADVAGKGMPAALLMALLQGSLRTLITAGMRGRQAVAKLNRYLCESIPPNRLVTMFYGELNLSNGSLRYVNAGHNAPFLLRPGLAPVRLASTSIPLGVVESDFQEQETSLDDGTRLVIFTDGLSETFNAADEEYGESRLEAFLQKNSALPQDALIGKMMEDVLAFCGDVRPHDDITVMTVERKNH